MTTKLPWIKLGEPNGPPLEEHIGEGVLVIQTGGFQTRGYYCPYQQSWIDCGPVAYYCPIDTDTSEAVHIDTLKPKPL